MRRALARLLDSTIGPPALMLGAAIAGLIWANVDHESYASLFEHHLRLGTGSWAIDEDLHGWINDALMTLFFFGVGLEIKRELVVGELQDRRRAALPAIAALGGMIVPAVIYAAVNLLGDGELDGWAIPVATDIAFALGVLSLLGSRVPIHLRLFVLTLAIVDDVGGVVIIAFAFSEDLDPAQLALAGACLLAIGAMRRAGIASPLAYVPAGVAAWYFTSRAGIEPTIAGVVLGLITPAVPIAGRAVLEDLEHRLHPLNALLVLPVFALANTGIPVDGATLADTLTGPIGLGVILGLVVGKTVGITLATHAALRLGLGRLHDSVSPSLIAPVALLAGIGFTVALFITELSFDTEVALAEAKLGVLLGSVIAAVLGFVSYRAVHRRIDARP